MGVISITDYLDEMVRGFLENSVYPNRVELEIALNTLVDDVSEEAANYARSILKMGAQTLQDEYEVEIKNELPEEAEDD